MALLSERGLGKTRAPARAQGMNEVRSNLAPLILPADEALMEWFDGVD